VILVGLLASAGLAGGPENGLDDISRFMTYYYLHPAPEKLPTMLKDFLGSGRSADGKSLDAAREYQCAYFFARASESDPNIVESYTSFFESGTYAQRLFILRILEFCGNENTKRFFEANLRVGRFSREQDYIVQALEEGIPLKFEPITEPIRGAGDLDFLWTEFTVTGSEDIIKRIVSVLHLAQDGKGPEKLVGGAARWMLAVQCRAHERVLEICQEELPKSTGATREILQKVVSESDYPTSVSRLIREGHHEEVPSDIKSWALGCAGVLWERNHDRYDSLAGEDVNDRNIRARKKLLSDSWGIENRADLFGVLRRLDETGHRDGFEDLGKYVSVLGEWEYIRFLLMNMMNAERLYEIKTAKKHYEELGEKGILGWDYSRYICLCRWGYEVGYITEEEAWKLIIPAAWKLQEKFDSWEDLGCNYLIGREFWGGGADSTYKFEDAYQRLIDMPSSPWNRYDWYMDLRYFADNQDKRIRQDED